MRSAIRENLLLAAFLLLPLNAAVLAQTEVWTESTADEFRNGIGVETLNINISSGDGDDGSLALAPALENFAKGKPAADTDDDDRSNAANLTDEDPNTLWFSYTVNPVGVSLIVDLQAVRLIDSVRVEGPSAVLDRNADKRIKGFRLEVSLDGNNWTIVADVASNPDRHAVVTFEPITARFVRVTITATDDINWTFISEIKVYGSGFASLGVYKSKVQDFGQLVNFGTATWDPELPEGTSLSLRFRSDSLVVENLHVQLEDSLQLPHAPLMIGSEVITDTTGSQRFVPTVDYLVDYERGVLISLHKAGGGIEFGKDLLVSYRVWGTWTPPSSRQTGLLLRIPEPRQYLQYEATLATQGLETPKLHSISVSYSVRPVARRAEASVSPQEVDILKPALLTYTVDLEFDEDDLGIDTLTVLAPSEATVEGVRLNGASTGYTSVGSGKTVQLVFDQPIREAGAARLEVELSTVLFLSENLFPSTLSSRATPDNPQFVQQSPEGWLVQTSGIPESTLLNIEVTPNPFSPNGDNRFDIATIKFFVAKLTQPRRVSVKIYSLNNDRVNTLFSRHVRADFYTVQWDGTDAHGRRVRPGVYLCQVRVESDQGDSVSTRPIVVAY